MLDYQSLIYIHNLSLNLTFTIMQNIISRIHGPLVVLVDIAILLSLASDWVTKYRAHKEATASATVTTEESADDD